MGREFQKVGKMGGGGPGPNALCTVTTRVIRNYNCDKDQYCLLFFFFFFLDPSQDIHVQSGLVSYNLFFTSITIPKCVQLALQCPAFRLVLWGWGGFIFKNGALYM